MFVVVKNDPYIGSLSDLFQTLLKRSSRLVNQVSLILAEQYRRHGHSGVDLPVCGWIPNYVDKKDYRRHAQGGRTDQQVTPP